MGGVWAGFSFEVGGEIVFGTQTQEGLLVSIGDCVANRRDQIRYLTYEQRAISLGAGLGGSVGSNFVVAMGVVSPQNIVKSGDKAEFDWSLDLVLKGLDKYFRSIPECIELAAIARKFDRNLMRLADGLGKYEQNVKCIKTAAENVVKNASGLADTVSGEPALLTFPLAGTGLRLSARMKYETTNLTQWGTL